MRSAGDMPRENWSIRAGAIFRLGRDRSPLRRNPAILPLSAPANGMRCTLLFNTMCVTISDRRTCQENVCAATIAVLKSSATSDDTVQEVWHALAFWLMLMDI